MSWPRTLARTRHCRIWRCVSMPFASTPTPTPTVQRAPSGASGTMPPAAWRGGAGAHRRGVVARERARRHVRILAWAKAAGSGGPCSS